MQSGELFQHNPTTYIMCYVVITTVGHTTSQCDSELFSYSLLIHLNVIVASLLIGLLIKCFDFSFAYVSTLLAPDFVK